MNVIGEAFESLINNIQILFNKGEFEPIKVGIQMHANIIFSDLKRNDNIVLYITSTKQKIYRGFSTWTGLSFIGPSKEWIDIINGKKALSTSIAEGAIKVPNLRVNWAKSWILSHIIKCVNNFN